MNINKIILPEKRIIYLYIIFKLAALISLILILPIYFEKSYFYSNDFYNLYNKCELLSPNFLFSIITCFLGIKTLVDPASILVSISISIIKDYLFLIIAIKYLNKNFLYIFILALSLHPYLNLYYLKFTTDLFSNLGIALYCFYIFNDKINKNISNIVFLILSMIRNSLVFLFVTHYLFQIYLNFSSVKKLNNEFSLKKNLFLIFLLLSSVLLINMNYAKDFLSSNKIYDLNTAFFVSHLDFLPNFLGYFFAIIFNVITHAILLLGFREQAYTEFLYFFSSQNGMLKFYLIMGFSLFLFHLVGFYYFIRTFVKKYPYLIILVIYLIPNLFLVSHMRYFMPMMPISILGLCLLMQNRKDTK